ncbi:PREDICTED: transmembrane protein 59-like [Priapulus caudatus]|uniref:Transmembrane protein 59-like n=1 Tax=Priapulus caudatus TaxID=37621 RepID=A0ABM1DQW8_PRICU|nr:PREDICTED: transmembrane protein 59-like [Priapulus caudatus]
MASKYLLMIFVLYICTHCAFSDTFDRVFGSLDPCNSACDTTYPLHTYPKSEHLDSCKRGCRLFAISGFMSTSNDLNDTKELCLHSCSEAYVNDTQYACGVGCTSQLPFAKKRQEKLMMEDQHIHVLSPLVYIQSYYSDMMDLISKGVASMSWSCIRIRTAGRREDCHRTGSTHGSFTYITRRNVRADTIAALVADEAQVASRDWLSCVSKKMGLPHWLLVGTVFLSALVFVFICLTTAATTAGCTTE